MINDRILTFNTIMDEQPTKAELLHIIKHIEKRGDYTHRQICELIIEDYPNCILSVKVSAWDGIW